MSCNVKNTASKALQCQKHRIQYTTMSKPTRHYNLKCIKNTASKPNVSQTHVSQTHVSQTHVSQTHVSQTHISKTPNIQNHKEKTTQTNTKKKKQQKLHSTKNIDIIKRHI
ncbi:hypothetical protein B5C09_11090 [Staphylococcus delphini]|nr:hypothetical protein B5C09_11090 [Staphylococcus delphini]PCF73707.1 hypothetical protein B4W71_06915 [Staphylococcus delphini]